MQRKSPASNRAVDLHIDDIARRAARAVGEAANDGRVVRFLNRFLDALHDADNEVHGIGPLDWDPDSPRRRRRRRGN